MPVAVGNTSSANGNVTTLAWVHTLGSGSDLVLICTVGVKDGITISSVTWDTDGVNEALTLVRTVDNPGLGRCALYFLLNPSVATGSSELAVISSAKNRCAAGGITFTGATTPDEDVGANVEVATSILQIAANVVDDDFVVSAVVIDDGRGMTVGPQETEVYQLAMGTGPAAAKGGGAHQDGADGGQMSWTWTNSGQATLAVARIPAAAVEEGRPEALLLVGVGH